MEAKILTFQMNLHHGFISNNKDVAEEASS